MTETKSTNYGRLLQLFSDPTADYDDRINALESLSDVRLDSHTISVDGRSLRNCFYEVLCGVASNIEDNELIRESAIAQLDFFVEHSDQTLALLGRIQADVENESDEFRSSAQKLSDQLTEKSRNCEPAVVDLATVKCEILASRGSRRWHGGKYDLSINNIVFQILVRSSDDDRKSIISKVSAEILIGVLGKLDPNSPIREELFSELLTLHPSLDIGLLADALCKDDPLPRLSLGKAIAANDSRDGSKISFLIELMGETADPAYQSDIMGIVRTPFTGRWKLDDLYLRASDFQDAIAAVCLASLKKVGATLSNQDFDDLARSLVSSSGSLAPRSFVGLKFDGTFIFEIMQERLDIFLRSTTAVYVENAIAAVTFISDSAHPGAENKLISTLEKSPHPKIGAACIDGLGKIGSTTSLTSISVAVSRNPDLKTAAFSASFRIAIRNNQGIEFSSSHLVALLKTDAVDLDAVSRDCGFGGLSVGAAVAKCIPTSGDEESDLAQAIVEAIKTNGKSKTALARVISEECGLISSVGPVVSKSLDLFFKNSSDSGSVVDPDHISGLVHFEMLSDPIAARDRAAHVLTCASTDFPLKILSLMLGVVERIGTRDDLTGLISMYSSGSLKSVKTDLFSAAVAVLKRDPDPSLSELASMTFGVEFERQFRGEIIAGSFEKRASQSPFSRGKRLRT